MPETGAVPGKYRGSPGTLPGLLFVRQTNLRPQQQGGSKGVLLLGEELQFGAHPQFPAGEEFRLWTQQESPKAFRNLAAGRNDRSERSRTVLIFGPGLLFGGEITLWFADGILARGSLHSGGLIRDGPGLLFGRGVYLTQRRGGRVRAEGPPPLI